MKSIRKSMKALSWGLMLVGVSATIAIGQVSNSAVQVDREIGASLIANMWDDVFRAWEVNWSVDGESTTEGSTVAKSRIYPKEQDMSRAAFLSSSGDFPRTNQIWKYSVPLEKSGNSIGVVDRKGPMTLKGSKESDRGWFGRHIPYLKHVKTVIRHPHLRVGDFIGGSTTDLLYDLRRDGYLRLEWQMKF